jgi:uncharacterized repeat protein (TIGR03803 family)
VTRPRALSLIIIFCTATAIASPAQVPFAVLASFDGTDGANPFAGLIQASDGNFYGTTPFGGASNDCGVGGCGTVFKVTVGGTLTTLHSFDMADGASPFQGLIQAADENFYGTTRYGGAYGYGTFFKITPTGELSTLYSFKSAADTPYSALVQGSDGNFYGTTTSGGGSGCGTVFKITTGGMLNTLHIFDCTHGSQPIAALIQASDGNFYGTTTSGGQNSAACPYGCGTIFGITPAGKLTTLHRFNATDGAVPNASLVQAIDGNFYGRTLAGGANNSCPPYIGCGTIFKMTPAGELTTLYSFESSGGQSTGNFYATAGLVQGTDGNFYGTTVGLGPGSEDCAMSSCGTVFRITADGVLTTLHTFDSIVDAYPFGGLVQATDGKFYGTTLVGGGTRTICAIGCGTVFRLSVGLGPFVEPRPDSGEWRQSEDPR